MPMGGGVSMKLNKVFNLTGFIKKKPGDKKKGELECRWGRFQKRR